MSAVDIIFIVVVPVILVWAGIGTVRYERSRKGVGRKR